MSEEAMSQGIQVFVIRHPEQGRFATVFARDKAIAIARAQEFHPIWQEAQESWISEGEAVPDHCDDLPVTTLKPDWWQKIGGDLNFQDIDAKNRSVEFLRVRAVPWSPGQVGSFACSTTVFWHPDELGVIMAGNIRHLAEAYAEERGGEPKDFESEIVEGMMSVLGPK